MQSAVEWLEEKFETYWAQYGEVSYDEVHELYWFMAPHPNIFQYADDGGILGRTPGPFFSIKDG